MKKYFDKIYVISSTKNSFLRKKEAAKQLESIGWYDYEFIEAVWGDELPEDLTELVRSGELAKEFKDPNGMLTRNIIACAMSHKKAYAKFLEDGHETALILEDDIIFTSDGYQSLLTGKTEQMMSTLNKQDWGVFFWGWSNILIPGKDVSLHPIYEVVRYFPEWGAHAYQINRKSAQTLLDTNTPIQYAADVNLECSDLNLFAPTFSHICQRMGDLIRPHAQHLTEKYEESVIQNVDFNGGAFLPATIQHSTPTTNFNELLTSIANNDPIMYQDFNYDVRIEGTIPISSIHWNPFTNERGDTLYNWLTIEFRE